MTLKDAAHLVRTAVDETISHLDLHDADAAAVKLARYYADVIDEADDEKLRSWMARWIVPQLLDCLDQLGATPAARARITKGEPARVTDSRLTALRAARR